MKVTKPIVIAGAIATLVAGGGVAYAQFGDIQITPAPKHQTAKPVEKPAVQPDVSETPVTDTTESSSTTSDTPEVNETTPTVDNQSDNVNENQNEPTTPAEESTPADQPDPTPEPLPAPETCQVCVSNDNTN